MALCAERSDGMEVKMEQETEKTYNVSGYPLTVEQQKIIE